MTDAVQVALIVAVPSTLASLAAVITSLRNFNKLDAIHVEMNGRFTQMLASTKIASHAEGVLDEHERVKTPENP